MLGLVGWVYDKPFHPTRQWRFDYQFPGKVAVEIDGGHFHGSSPKKIKQDKAKSDYLIPRGWTIERFRVTSEDQIESVAKKIVSLL